MRRFASAALVVAALAITPRAHAADPDPWLGRDKALHFGASVLLGAGGYALSLPFVEPRWQRATIGATVSLAFGAGKEGVDALGFGTPSWRDFTWDVIGTAVGVGIAVLVDSLLREPSPSTGATAQGLALRF